MIFLLVNFMSCWLYCQTMSGASREIIIKILSEMTMFSEVIITVTIIYY